MANIADSIVQDIHDIVPTVFFEDYAHADWFSCIAEMHADRNIEKLVPIWEADEYSSESGLVYIIVVDGVIFKIGQTSKTMKARIQSYNCGKQSYRDNGGTNSVSNYYVLQSLIALQNDNISRNCFENTDSFEDLQIYEEVLAECYDGDEIAEDCRPKIEFYAWYAPKATVETFFGDIIESSGDSAKRSEGELICDFENTYGSRPVGNVQR